jgi:hypothetical protein
MKKINYDKRYAKKELLLFNISTLSESFIAIKNCTKVKDIELQMKDESSSKVFLLFIIYYFEILLFNSN